MVIGANMTNYIKNLRNMNKELMARLILEKGCYNLRRKTHGLAHGYVKYVSTMMRLMVALLIRIML